MCDLCPRRCNVSRLSGDRGFCGAVDEVIRISRAALHFWEEPCISGTRGSGTVFFSYCSLKCVYCQNTEISRGLAGADVDVSRLAEIMLELQERGAHNINLVTPTHYVNHITAALDIAKSRGLTLPIVYNTGGYELPSVINKLRGYVDIFLTDYKYADNEDAKKYSGVSNYVEFADEALEKMVEIAPLKFENVEGCRDDNTKQEIQIMKSGVIVRHLVLPSSRRDSMEVLDIIAKTVGVKNVRLSLMSQYTPEFALNCNIPCLHRKVTSFEYNSVLDHAEKLGFEGYFQDRSSACTNYTPEF